VALPALCGDVLGVLLGVVFVDLDLQSLSEGMVQGRLFHGRCWGVRSRTEPVLDHGGLPPLGLLGGALGDRVLDGVRLLQHGLRAAGVPVGLLVLGHLTRATHGMAPVSWLSILSLTKSDNKADNTE